MDEAFKLTRELIVMAQILMIFDCSSVLISLYGILRVQFNPSHWLVISNGLFILWDEVIKSLFPLSRPLLLLDSYHVLFGRYFESECSDKSAYLLFTFSATSYICTFPLSNVQLHSYRSGSIFSDVETKINSMWSPVLVWYPVFFSYILSWYPKQGVVPKITPLYSDSHSFGEVF